MPTARVNGIGVHYQVVGRPPDVVMIHGLSSNLAFWHLRFALPLSRRFRATTYDLRGHGYSDTPPAGYSSAEMAKDLCGLLDHLGIERAHLVGHSFGAAVALHFAVLFPRRVRTLTLADPWIYALQPHACNLGGARGRPPFWLQWRQRLRDAGVDVPDDLPYVAYALIEETARNGSGTDNSQEPTLGADVEVSDDPAAPRSLAPTRWAANSRVLQRWRQLLGSTSVLADLRDPAGLCPGAIQQVRAPALLTCGQFSPFRPTSQQLGTLLPRSTSVLVPNAGHAHPTARPLLFARYLLRFLRCYP
jgi:pimeloyl-ACP methyl ester carboxylesterase